MECAHESIESLSKKNRQGYVSRQPLHPSSTPASHCPSQLLHGLLIPIHDWTLIIKKARITISSWDYFLALLCDDKERTLSGVSKSSAACLTFSQMILYVSAVARVPRPPVHSWPLVIRLRCLSMPAPLLWSIISSAAACIRAKPACPVLYQESCINPLDSKTNTLMHTSKKKLHTAALIRGRVHSVQKLFALANN